MKESIEHIQPIEASSIEEHEKILRARLTEIQLEYIDRLFSKQIPPVEELEDKDKINDFGFLLNKYTPILRILMNNYIHRIEKEGIKWDSKMYDPIEEEFKNKIQEFYEKDYKNWINKTKQLIDDEEKKAGVIEEREYLDEDKREKAGLINFNTAINTGVRPTALALKDLGIKDEDEYIAIHLEALFRQKKDKDKELSLFSEDSFKELALKIINKYPETSAIVGQSWLMDTPIAEKAGFKIANKKFRDERDEKISWNQFIDSNGQIQEGRVSKFLKTGQPPYKEALGVILVEDFLKKYLPKEYKGKVITLKEVDPKFLEKFENDKKPLDDMRLNWDKISEEEVEKNFNFFKGEFMGEFIKTPIGKDFIQFLKESKRQNKTLEDIGKDKKIKVFNEALQDFLKDKKFINKEIIIE